MKSKFLFGLAITLLILLLPLAACYKPGCVERLVEDCVCTQEYNPVCGCNDKTYPNACAAECAGIKKYHKGPCEKS